MGKYYACKKEVSGQKRFPSEPDSCLALFLAFIVKASLLGFSPSFLQNLQCVCQVPSILCLLVEAVTLEKKTHPRSLVFRLSLGESEKERERVTPTTRTVKSLQKKRKRGVRILRESS
jgi:hypothetical protein